MKSRTSARFRKVLSKLPLKIRKQAKEAYFLFKIDPYHPSLHFKRIHSTQPIYSVRINITYRAIGIIEKDEIIWIWVGAHAEYDRLLRSL
ncbi:MAG: hypothetical protein ACKVQC_04450 [Elusimicrobiota bacterium]